MPYIYKITNLINNKIYIGKTSYTIDKRFKEHISDSKRERYEKRPLYDAMNKYGIENFIVEEVEKVENDDIASEREQYWINKLRTYVGFKDCNGYNATLGGDSKRYYNYKEIADKYLELKSEKEVMKYFHCDWKTVQSACLENNIKISDNRKRQGIRKFNSDKTEYKDYTSISEAAKDFPEKDPETARKNISRAVNEGTKGYGYYWIKIDNIADKV